MCTFVSIVGWSISIIRKIRDKMPCACSIYRVPWIHYDFYLSCCIVPYICYMYNICDVIQYRIRPQFSSWQNVFIQRNFRNRAFGQRKGPQLNMLVPVNTKIMPSLDLMFLYAIIDLLTLFYSLSSTLCFYILHGINTSTKNPPSSPMWT